MLDRILNETMEDGDFCEIGKEKSLKIKNVSILELAIFLRQNCDNLERSLIIEYLKDGVPF